MTNASALLDALSDPSRRAIFELLVDRPASVTEVARDMPISRPAVSQHLQVLKSAGLVTDRVDGTRRIYRVEPEALAMIREYFDLFWRRSLASFQQAARHTEGEP